MAAYFCPHCKVKATFEDKGPRYAWQNAEHSIWRCNDCNGAVYVQVTSTDVIMYPFVRSEAPREYPEGVRENFAEAIRSLNGNNPKACVVMTRSAMQAATRQLEAKGGNLKEEIEDLAAGHIIPDSLKDWAHHIRDGGNLVAHPEPGKWVEKEDAEELLELAESIFEYLYVVPEQVSRRRERIASLLKADAEKGEPPTQ